MSEHLLDRAQIRAWVEDIDVNNKAHKPVLKLLLSKQRPLSRYMHNGVSAIGLKRKSTVLFITGVLLRIFDLAGGGVRKVTPADLKRAEGRVSAWVAKVIPWDDGFAARVRDIAERSQPHLLDECLVDVFDNPELTDIESAKLFFLVWIAVEALDVSWSPPADFEGPASYVFSPPEADGSPDTATE